MTQPLSTITNQGYDTQDNPASVTDPRNHTTQYVYDDFGRKDRTVSPDTGTTKYEYDEAGNLTKRVDANGTTVNYTYDALNRLTAIHFPDSSQDIAFTYDSTSVTYGKGRLTGRTDPSGTYTFYYDAQGNLAKEEKTIGSILYTTEYGYNKDNVLTSITYPYITSQTGREVSYTLDVTGRVTQVSTTLNGNPKTLASSISYLPYGGITGLTYGNTISLTQGHDLQYRITSIVAGSVLDRSYDEYDANGNVQKITDHLETSWNRADELAEVYTYDTETNLLDYIWGQVPVVYDYDDNANTVSANTWTYVYDLSNQLIRVLHNTNQVAEYTYNGAGQRIKKVTQSGTRIFHYDLSGHLIAETNGAGQTLVEYIYLGDKLLAMIKPGEVAYYFHNDHLGTPQILTDDLGRIAWKAVYTPFGEAVASIQTVDNPFRFPGQYYDQETGLHYNYFRYYDPSTGRYVTPDPIGLEGRINLFAYVANNPLNFRDPVGLWGEDVHSGIGNPYYGTYTWARQIGLSDRQAIWIVIGNNSTDGGFASWMPILGLQSRHFNQLQSSMIGFSDSRDFWASVELNRAVNYYRQGKCETAFRHLGKGLHSIQDKIAHGDWDTGWHGMTVHPDWFDVWSDPRNRSDRELTEKATKEYILRFLNLTGQK